MMKKESEQAEEIRGKDISEIDLSSFESIDHPVNEKLSLEIEHTPSPISHEASNQEHPEEQIQDLIHSKRFDEAAFHVEALLKQDPENPDAYYLKGILSHFQGKLGQAVDYLQRALSKDPRHTDAAICLSVLLNDIGKYSEAKTVFERANQSVAYQNIGDHYGVDRKFAVKHLELGDLYFRYKRYDEAVDEYGRAALLDPSALDIRVKRAKAYAKKGFVTRAVQELQQLKMEHPRFLTARIQLGLLHYSQGNILDAELEWEQVADIDPMHREAKAYLEMAREARMKE